MDCQVTGLPGTVTQVIGTKLSPPGNCGKSPVKVFKVNIYLIQKYLLTCLLVPDGFKRPTDGWD